VAGAGNDNALHVVRGELHRVRAACTDAFGSADRQDGKGQSAGLAPLVLPNGDVERAVGREAAAQNLGVGGQGGGVVTAGGCPTARCRAGQGR
jgi:hypothetical protein